MRRTNSTALQTVSPRSRGYSIKVGGFPWKYIASISPGLKEMTLAALQETSSSILSVASVAVASSEPPTHKVVASLAWLNRLFGLPKW